MAAFSATFKLLKTKFLILATHCTNKSKSAEPRAEQRPLDCYAEARKLFNVSKRASLSLDFVDKITNDMDTMQLQNRECARLCNLMPECVQECVHF